MKCYIETINIVQANISKGVFAKLTSLVI